MRPFCLRCSVQNSVLGDDVPANQLTTNNVFLAEPDHTNTALFVVGHVVHDLEILTQAGLLRAAGNVVLGQIANDEQLQFSPRREVIRSSSLKFRFSASSMITMASR